MIIVVGAGIAGLSLGYELLKLGAKVTIVEASTIASGASGVATSYLEPRLGKTAMRMLEWEALRQWPNFVDEVQAASGKDLCFRVEGQIRVCLQENQEKFAKDLLVRAEQGWNFQELSPQAVREKLPDLSSEITAGAFLPDVRWVDGQAVCYALAQVIKASGGKILENWPVDRVEETVGQIKVINRNGESLEAAKVVLCSAMGTNALQGLPKDIKPARPVRGVNLVVSMEGLKQPIKHLIKHHRGNLCPRRGNRLIVGTTYEPEEQSLEPDETVVEKLYANASPILPVLRDMPLLAITAGLRSKIGDGNLHLGRSREMKNLYFSLSHAGAGFLRTPVVAPEFAEFILNEKPGELTQNFTVG